MNTSEFVFDYGYLGDTDDNGYSGYTGSNDPGGKRSCWICVGQVDLDIGISDDGG